MTGYVYAIGCGDAVKIGFSNEPAKRAQNLLTGNPGDAKLIGFIAATPEQERELHRLLAGSRIRGEWFRRGSKAVETFVSSIFPFKCPADRRCKDMKGPLRGANTSPTKLARAFGVDKSTVTRWQQNRIPAERVLDVERATGVPRHELRPDLYPPQTTEAAE